MKGVNELAASSHKTAACTCDIINYEPAVNTVNRRNIFACTFNYIVPIYNLEINRFQRFLNVFHYNIAALSY